MTTDVKERPIIMTGQSPRLILDGLKFQTRRVVKPQPSEMEVQSWASYNHCPHGVPGDRLYVREGFAYCPITYKPNGIIYRADGEDPHVMTHEWRPSIHMPRKASRILLEIMSVRVERIQDIRCASSPFHPDDIEAEGCPLRQGCFQYDIRARGWFRELWNSINQKRGFGWEVNPLVWVIEFNRIMKGYITAGYRKENENDLDF